MIEFTLKKVEDSPHYNINFIKLVHKRTGELVKEPGDTLYNISLDWAKYFLSCEDACINLKEEDVSLSRYLKEFHKSYNSVCELLKKTL